MLRLLYAVSRIKILENGNMVYDSGYDEVHIDEKWFDLTPEASKIYITKTEKELNVSSIQRKTRHKSHIVKVMFLAAVARPQFNNQGDCVFDGKIGLWPFVEKVPAKRNSKRRPKGTMETKCLSVTASVYQEYLINKVLPAIYAKWPRSHA